MDLESFLMVSKTGNISRAAERLGIGQPALSQLVGRLERQTGARLLDRFKTGVRLTAAGHRLADKGRVALEVWRELPKAALAAESSMEGSYTLGCHPSVALYSLKLFLPGLLRSHPGLHFRLFHGLSREVTEAVISFKVDFGIVVNPVRHPDLVIRPLCRDEVGFWRTARGIKDTLIYDPALAQSQILLRNAGKRLSFVRQIESGSLEVIANLAGNSCGTAILPARVARSCRELRQVKGLPTFQDQICLVYRADRKLSASAKVVIGKIQKAWRPGDSGET